MTPERIEEIKRENEEMIKTLKRVPMPSLVRVSGQMSELLAALEEAQRQLDEIKMKSHSKIYTQSVQIQTGLERIETLFNELAEAQQTIARQRKALEFYATQSNHKWSHTYDETGEVEEIPSKVANDRGRIARTALEEGETQP